MPSLIYSQPHTDRLGSLASLLSKIVERVGKRWHQPSVAQFNTYTSLCKKADAQLIIFYLRTLTHTMSKDTDNTGEDTLIPVSTMEPVTVLHDCDYYHNIQVGEAKSTDFKNSNDQQIHHQLIPTQVDFSGEEVSNQYWVLPNT